jgi:septal ring factor EnvC (AmiA/AmiB activator)
MGLEQLIHRVESNLMHLGRRLAGDGREERQEECRRLLADIARQEEALAAQQQHLFALQRRVKEAEDEVARLPEEVADSHRRGKAARALWQALLLDRRRQELAADRAELPRVEHLCWSLGFRLRQLRRQLDEVRAELRRG